MEQLTTTSGFQEKGCLFFLQADVAANAELPDGAQKDSRLHACCVTEAALVDELQAKLCEAGFSEIRITPKDDSRKFVRDWAPCSGMEDYVLYPSNEALKRRFEC